MIIGIFLMVTFFTASLVLIYLSIKSKKEMERKKKECTEIAKGTVETIRKIGDSENNDNYYPTFAFFDGNCIVQEESKIGYSKGVWKKGDLVQIRFNANKPSDFWVESDSIPGVGVAYFNRNRFCRNRCIRNTIVLFYNKILVHCIIGISQSLIHYIGTL